MSYLSKNQPGNEDEEVNVSALDNFVAFNNFDASANRNH